MWVKVLGSDAISGRVVEYSRYRRFLTYNEVKMNSTEATASQPQCGKPYELTVLEHINEQMKYHLKQLMNLQDRTACLPAAVLALPVSTARELSRIL